MEQDVITARVAQFCAQHCAAASPLIIAVSGGKDSVTLLHVLTRLTIGPLIVAHFDHALRGESADDAQFVRVLAATYGLQFVTERATSSPKSESVEEWGRRVRYEFLRRVKEEVQAQWIITAHTQDDQAETVMFALVRGSGLTGVSGMATNQGELLRPLLTTSRAEIERYAAANALEFRHDASNDDLAFSRNQIRHTVMPVLRRINTEASSNIARAASLARDTESLIEEEALRWKREQRSCFDIAAFVTLHIALQRTILRVTYHALHGSYKGCTFDTLERARLWILQGASGTRVPFGKDVMARRNRVEISFVSGAVRSNPVYFVGKNSNPHL